jgi:hypothetical protein
VVLQEFHKLSGRLFAASLSKFPMLDPALTGDVSANFDVKWWIDECELGGLAREQSLKRFPSPRVTAEEPVITKNPQIA